MTTSKIPAAAIAAFAFLCLDAPAYANTCDGPVTRVTGDKGYTSFRAFPSNATVDATGATWRTSQYPTLRNPWPVSINAKTNACMRGGAVIGDTPLNINWSTRYSKGNSAGVSVGSGNSSATPGTVVEGVRLYNQWDGLRAGSKATDTVFRGNWTEASHDDCVENDGKNTATVEDNLLDGCFAGFSARNPSSSAVAQPGELLTIERNLIRMRPVPGWPKAGKTGHLGVFKWQKNSLKIRLIDNVIAVQEGGKTQYGSWFDPLAIFQGKFVLADWNRYVLESRGNTIVWLGAGAYPYATPPGFTVTDDEGAWDRAKSAWLSRHSAVASG